MTTTTYTVGEVQYKREVIASFIDQLIIVRLTAPEKNMITFDTKLSPPSPQSSRSIYDGMLRMDATSSSHEGIEGKVKATTLVKIVNRGGSKNIVSGSIINITKADVISGN